MGVPLKVYASAGPCDRCGVERWKRHRHHKTPRSEGGSDDPSNIEMLCANCHEDEHRPGTSNGTDRLTQTPSAKARRSASFRRRWADPEYRRQIMEARATQVRSNGMTAEETAARRAEVLRLRDEEGLSQTEVAARLGIAQPTVSRYERQARAQLAVSA